jgi:hypothetical protein
MRSFKMKEISGVDRPAQQGAKVSIMKRNDAPDLAKGGMALTTMTAGHAHLIMMGGGEIDRKGGQTDYVDGHSHPWLIDEAGNITVGHAAGHNHGIEIIAKSDGTGSFRQATKGYGSADPEGEETKADETAEHIGNNKDESMTDHVKKSADDAAAVELKKSQEALAKATARAERAEALASLPVEHRKHFDGLRGDSAEAFLKADASERAEIVRKANESNTVVYTDMDGIEYRKSDDPRLIKMAKGMDEEKKKRIASEAKAAKADLEKRAAEFPHIAGGPAVVASLLKGIDSLPEEERKPALAALKAQNDRLGKATQTLGHAVAPEVDSTLDPLDQLAADISKRDNITFAAAYNKALNTAEGQKLYEEHINRMEQRS